MNTYADVAEYKEQMLRNEERRPRDDKLYLRYLEQASRDIDNYVGGRENWRNFYVDCTSKLFICDIDTYEEAYVPYTSAGTFSTSGVKRGSRFGRLARGQREFIIPDLINVNSVRVDRTTWESDDYDLYPLNASPKTRVAAKYTIFGYRSRTTITGKWGYEDVRDELEDHNTIGELQDSGGTPLTELSSTSTKFYINDDDTEFQMGQTLWIGDTETWTDETWDGAEQVFVRRVDVIPSGQSGGPLTTVTIKRGVNGTKKKTWPADTKLYKQMYPATIRQSCIDLAIRKHRGRATEWAGQGAEIESFTDIFSPISPQITHYRRAAMQVYTL